MRPLLALLLTTVILGSLALFFRLQSAPAGPSAAAEAVIAEGRFDIEITLTFAAGPDEFALSNSDAPALIVEFRGDQILRRTDTIEPGTPIVIEDVDGVAAGDNSFYVRCTPKEADIDATRAIRVRILRDDEVVADQTLWSAPGAATEGLVELTVEAAAESSDHDHQAKQPAGGAAPMGESQA